MFSVVIFYLWGNDRRRGCCTLLAEGTERTNTKRYLPPFRLKWLNLRYSCNVLLIFLSVTVGIAKFTGGAHTSKLYYLLSSRQISEPDLSTSFSQLEMTSTLWFTTQIDDRPEGRRVTIRSIRQLILTCRSASTRIPHELFVHSIKPISTNDPATSNCYPIILQCPPQQYSRGEGLIAKAQCLWNKYQGARHPSPLGKIVFSSVILSETLWLTALEIRWTETNPLWITKSHYLPSTLSGECMSQQIMFTRYQDKETIQRKENNEHVYVNLTINMSTEAGCNRSSSNFKQTVHAQEDTRTQVWWVRWSKRPRWQEIIAWRWDG